MPARTDRGIKGSERAIDPSMEGRARARPDTAPRTACCRLALSFNGGAGTCPPGPSHTSMTRYVSDVLQWRGGHVPARTHDASDRLESKVLLQWRGGHVPARTDRRYRSIVVIADLQWRGGHVPART